MVIYLKTHEYLIQNISPQGSSRLWGIEGDELLSLDFFQKRSHVTGMNKSGFGQQMLTK